MSGSPVPPMRKADFWTSLVLIATATAMLLQALTFPLRGTYAGVRNAWYVSPALLPLMVAASLIGLGSLLLVRAVRAGAAPAALADMRGFAFGRVYRATEDFWCIAALIAVYVYAYIPRIDFIAATAFFLLTFTALYHLDRPGPSRLLSAAFFGIGILLLVMALAGATPGVRTTGAFLLDLGVWMTFVLGSIAAYWLARGDAEAHRRLRHCFWISLLTPLLLGTVFKYGLLVPLPREGISVEFTDRIFYALRPFL